MKVQPLFLEPIFQEKIWGGKGLEDKFAYKIPHDKTGECWAISAHVNGPSTVENGPFSGKTLNEVWRSHPEVFGHYGGDTFPLLTKILDANQDLSVQVHPDNVYANLYENGELGKTECWYIIDCKKGAEIVYGHNAKTKEEFIRAIENRDWDKLLRRVKIKPGDFFYVPSGTIHALCEGTIVLETQQTSDITYRVYDYERKDKDGKKRELHLRKAIDVITIPHIDADNKFIVTKYKNLIITTFVENDFFSVHKWKIDGIASLTMDKSFMLCSVINGNGFLRGEEGEYSFNKGSHFILPAKTRNFDISGNCELIVSHL
ncbi:mannose-6-phosphate isomerase, class I [Priestia megaterium]|uniref:mannose-6-phosphate isomerase, class I n=2 Tax=Priestia megaterium TaxID=1404 RepID=UPI000BF8D339|nr:mannose-6-phosphate isomerase, class I [Priestia megaterium]RFB34222.1 mannose-6-phosphate isomerase, class I [Bacillus sp. RC]NGY69879.1 mannose-6-phosphate isomerase, class I [Priestia megaterium]PET69641.1 mannose-6-phosphate isomerase, class I [Priestia megaterium]PFE29063.1 mannose-6-phosphate isomerase, class I [Priestia megaterium]PFI69667.1 mannose-6-phosphate isomerase, class I [Priestia megaterium]